MSKTEYRLFHQRTAEKIRDEVSRLRDSLLFGSEKKVHKFGNVDVTCDIATLEILLSDYILDYENSEATDFWVLVLHLPTFLSRNYTKLI